MTRKYKKHRLLKLAVLIFAVYAAFSLVETQVQIRKQSQLVNQLQEDKAAREQTNAALSELIGSELSDERIAEIAREQLGLAGPDDILFVDSSRRQPADTHAYALSP